MVAVSLYRQAGKINCGGHSRPGIIKFPTIVQAVPQQFGAIFANEPERRHFAEYLTGLLVAEKKNVTSINTEFAETTDQSCLNRWITEVAWDEVELNRQRLAWLQTDPQPLPSFSLSFKSRNT